MFVLIVAHAISAKDNGDGAALRWLPGYCATTEFSSRMAVCSKDTSGAWHMLPTDDEVAGRRRCAKRCTRCRNCRFVSYSRQDNDCNWYADCRLGGLRDSPSGHHSAQIKWGRSGELARQRKSRLQPLHAPPTALMIYHIAKTGGTALGSLLNGNGWQARRHELRQQGQQLLLPLVRRPLRLFLCPLPSALRRRRARTLRNPSRKLLASGERRTLRPRAP